MSVLVALSRRFACLATSAIVRAPRLWRLFRGPLAWQFDWLALRWDALRPPGHLEPSRQRSPRSGDLRPRDRSRHGHRCRRLRDRAALPGGGGGRGRPLRGDGQEARRKTRPELGGRVRFERADSAALLFPDGAFELASLANMIPFFDELARMLSPGGYSVFGFSEGPATPISVAPKRLRSELARRGFADFAEFSAGGGSAFLARRAGAA